MTWYDLRELCRREGWFTAGTNEQLEKLQLAFYDGADERELAYLIWMCSDTDDFDEQITSIEEIIAKEMLKKERSYEDQ